MRCVRFFHLAAVFETNCQQVICGCRPHPELGEWAAAEKLQQGVLPLRPEVGFTDSLWKTLESCWQSQRNMRPSVNAVLRELDQASRA